jgi:hypothetical protein
MEVVPFRIVCCNIIPGIPLAFALLAFCVGRGCGRRAAEAPFNVKASISE